MRRFHYATASLLAIAAVPCHARTSDAGSPQAAPADPADTPVVLDDIVVTAQRRSERIERVPASVQVISGEAISDFRQTTLTNVAVSVPNLVLTSSPSGAVQANIRGIGTPTANAGFEQSVALYIDGVYQPRPNSYTGSLFDIERIEVVKGTQGTLFGKNASVGAIGLITRSPGRDLGGYLDASYDFTLNGTRLEGALNVPAGDTFRLRVAGLYGDETRGWVYNRATGKHEPTSEEYGIRAKADWDVTSNLTLNGKLEYSKLDRTGNAFILVPGNVVGGAVDVGDITKNAFSNGLRENGGLPGMRRRGDTETIGGNWQIGGLTITALSAWTGLRTQSFSDIDNTTGPIDYAVRYIERFNQFTQELRLASAEDQSFSYQAGLFYLDQSLSYQTQVRFTPAPADQRLRTSVKTYSAFAQGKYEFTDSLSVTAGARVTKEDKDGALRVIRNAGTATTARSVKTTNVDWNVVAEYLPARDVRLYGTISRGHKAPGYLNSLAGAGLVPNQLVFPAEHATNYEIGVKARFLGGRARGNVAVYNLEVKDYQGSEYVPSLLGFVTSSVDVRARGVEAELQFQLLRDLRVGGSGAYNDGIIKATGNQMISAPHWNATANVSFTPAVSGDLRGVFSALLNYTSKFPNQFDIQPGNFTPGRTLLDLRLGVRHDVTGIELALIGRNVTDKRYVDFASGYPFAAPNTVFFDQIARPRTIALELKLPFGRN